MDEINLNIVRETFGKVVYTHKTYEKASDIYRGYSNWIKRLNTFALILTSGTAIGSLITGTDYLLCTSIFSTFSLFITVYQLHFDYSTLAQEYKYTAKRLWLIREKYQNLIADILNERYELNEIPTKRDSLLLEYNQILENSITTNSKAYSKAQEALKKKEEMTFTDMEIDMFLPSGLRKGK